MTHTSKLTSESQHKTKLYDKRDAFNFPIVNFPFTCFIILLVPAYGVYATQLIRVYATQLIRVYATQLIRYSRACCSYHDCFHRLLLLTRKLLNQWFLVVQSKSSLRKSYGRHYDLVNRYEISVSQITADMFPFSLSQYGPFLIHSISPGL